jgi:hypothetical protein
LLVKWLPAHEQVVGRFALQDLGQLLLQRQRGGEPRIRALLGSLGGAAIGVDRFVPVADFSRYSLRSEASDLLVSTSTSQKLQPFVARFLK